MNKHRYLGINGLGRIGKLTLWNMLNDERFKGFVINAGRQVGQSFEDMIDFIMTDSTYGSLSRFLYGYTGRQCEVEIIDHANCTATINGKYIKVLTSERNPKEIGWGNENVAIVVDCTGVFLDPNKPADGKGGSARGHLEAGAKKVICSAPFKLEKGASIPKDALMTVFGINHDVYDSEKHHVLSSASCTTTALSHMMKPLMDNTETKRIITASMSTIHASTNNQTILDGVPKAGAKDLRRNRSVFNNIILTSTGAAKALEVVMPEIAGIGFMADSVRIPANTVSLVSLNITFRSALNGKGEPVIDTEFLNHIYKEAAGEDHNNLLVYTDKQTVSSDVRGKKASVVIEGFETHTRTGFISLPKEILFDCGVVGDIQLPVTHAKIFGWYDNEFGNYVNSLSHLIGHVDDQLRGAVSKDSSIA